MGETNVENHSNFILEHLILAIERQRTQIQSTQHNIDNPFSIFSDGQAAMIAEFAFQRPLEFFFNANFQGLIFKFREAHPCDALRQIPGASQMIATARSEKGKKYK